MAKIVRENGTMRARIITPGQGTSGYYSPQLLKDSAAKFAGVQVYWDHPTEQEESGRPERSLRDLAGKVLANPAPAWQESGSDGPGIYGEVQVYKPYQEAVNELGPDIGLSIRASGKAGTKVVEGKQVKAIESIDHVTSVDFVTLPGRGGKPLQIFEAARKAGRDAALRETSTNPQENDMDAAELRKLQESNTALQADLRRLRDREALREAAVPIAEYLRTVVASDPIKNKVTQRVLERCVTPPLTDKGELDHAQVKKFAEAELLEQMDLLRQINPQLVSGMGPKTTTAPTKEAKKESKKLAKEARRELKESNRRFTSMMSLGETLGKRGRKIMLEGRCAFDPNYNSRVHGAQITGGGGSLPGLEA